MKRREFIAAILALLASRGQSSRRRVGFLAVGDGSGQALNQAEAVWLDGLRSHGWLEGKNLTIDYRFSQPADRLPASVADLISLDPDVLVAAEPQAAAALKSAAGKVPIVFAAVGGPVGIGLVQSLSRPSGNIKGFATTVPADFLGKRIEILRELLPSASKIALLVNPRNPWKLILAEYLLRTAQKLSLALPIVEAITVEELDVAFSTAAAQRADGIVDLGGPLAFVEAPRIVALAAQYRLPANYLFPALCQWRFVRVWTRYTRRDAPNGWLRRQDRQGRQAYRSAGGEADQIRTGDSMKVARSLGLTVSPSPLARADEVIDKGAFASNGAIAIRSRAHESAMRYE